MRQLHTIHLWHEEKYFKNASKFWFIAWTKWKCFHHEKIEWMAAFYYSFDWMKANIFISLSLFCHCPVQSAFWFSVYGITMMHLSQCNSWDIVVGLVRLNIRKYCRCSGNNGLHSIRNIIVFIHNFIVSCWSFLFCFGIQIFFQR